MYGDNLVELRKSIAEHIVDTSNSILVFEKQGYMPKDLFYSKLAIGCILKDCANIINDVNIDFNKTTKLLYNNFVTT